METFWNTIASYNAATWPAQILIVVIAAVLLVMLYRRPCKAVRMAMKIYMAAINLWIAVVYYLIYCQPREYNGMMALFWAIMGCIWIYDIAVDNASMERIGRRSPLAVLLLAMPLIYPLFSLALGRSFPMMTSPVMPCSVAVFTVGLMLAFSRKANIILAMFLCHWALIGLSKVYFFGIPEDYLLACSVVPALYVFFREYIDNIRDKDSKPSPGVMTVLLVMLCAVIGVFFILTLFRQMDLFAYFT